MNLKRKVKDKVYQRNNKKEKLIISKEEDLINVFSNLEKKKNKIFVFAGPSSSGKTFLSEKFKEFLEKKGKKVVLISLDNFYRKHSLIYSIIYGSFDHIRLFDIKYLNKCLDNLFNKGYCYLPIYSFIEKDRVGYKKIEVGKDDYIIIEGLYPFKMINKKILNKAVKVFITTDEDELLMRRILRDPERTKEPLNIIIENLTSVFPFWQIFGKNQINIADVVIYNNYNVLSKFEKKKEIISKEEFEKLKKKYKYKIFVTYNYIYKNKKKIVIKENYPLRSDILDNYKLSVEEKNKFYEIDFKYLGKISRLHLLMQNLGMKFLGINKNITIVFYEEEKVVLEVEQIKEGNKIKYVKKFL